MNRDDQFEKVLQRQTIKPLPSAWRDEILDAAISASPRSSRGNEALKISNLFWPNPKAWAGLAAAWALILGLNLANRETADPRLARRDAPPSPLVRELLQQQERLFAELVGPLETPEATPPKRVGPGPRSSREQNPLPRQFSCSVEVQRQGSDLIWSLDFGASLELGSWSLEFPHPRASVQLHRPGGAASFLWGNTV